MVPEHTFSISMISPIGISPMMTVLAIPTTLPEAGIAFDRKHAVQQQSLAIDIGRSSSSERVSLGSGWGVGGVHPVEAAVALITL